MGNIILRPWSRFGSGFKFRFGSRVKRNKIINLKRFILIIVGMNKKKLLALDLILLLVAPMLTFCASTEEPDAKVHRAAFSMDNFTIEQGMPLREVQKKEFYFKHCELETRRAFTSKAEFSCNEN